MSAYMRHTVDAVRSVRVLREQIPSPECSLPCLQLEPTAVASLVSVLQHTRG